MKNRKIECLIGILMCCISLGSLAQTADEWDKKMAAWKEKAKDAYVFPVFPGTPEWSALKTPHARVQALQVPENLLKTMSTPGLVETCLNYPFAVNIAIFDSYQMGLEGIIHEFNGFQELLQRQNIGNVLLDVYRAMDPGQLEEQWQQQRPRRILPSLQFLIAETLLTQDRILAQLSPSMRRELLKESLRVFRAKTQFPTHIGGQTPAAVMGKVLESLDAPGFRQRLRKEPPSQHYRDFINNGGKMLGKTDEEMVHAIVSNAEAYLATQPQEGGQP